MPSTDGGTERSGAWDTRSHDEFFRYYESESLSPATLARFRSACEMLLRTYGSIDRPLDVLDVGCGAGAQSVFWIEHGHRYRGVDINAPLIELARTRAERFGLAARFDVATATALPLADGSVDICLLPELLEHVADWQTCLDEALRVIRSRGLLFISTSSYLCPRQQEFNLPMYSWYPAPLKRYCERLAMSTRPGLANFATYPAVNWFSFFQLRRHLESKGFTCSDRFDVMDPGASALRRAALGMVRGLPPLRLLGHVLTPYTLVVARRG